MAQEESDQSTLHTRSDVRPPHGFPLAPPVASTSIASSHAAPSAHERGRAAEASCSKSRIAEIRNGKVVFRQKPISFEKASETMQEIVKFREMLDKRVTEQALPLTSIPQENMPLIVKLAQESDKAVLALAKQIRSTLFPGQGEVDEAYRTSLESCFPLSTVEHAIKTVMMRVNYGLECPLGQKTPAAVCVWRWEVQDAYKDWIPKSARDTAEARVAERVQAKIDLSVAFKSLPEAQQLAILVPKGIGKLPTKDMDQATMPSVVALETLSSSEDKEVNLAPMDVDIHSDNVTPKGRPKRVLDPEKVKKKEEKKAARAEKYRKEKEAQNKSRSILANFFGKAKPSAHSSPSKDINASAGPSSIENDFQRTFRPFVLKKDAELASHTWFLDRKRRESEALKSGATHDDAIVVHDDAVTTDGNVDMLLRDNSPLGDGPGDLPNTLRLLRRWSLAYPRMRRVPSFKTYNPLPVRDLVARLNDAEIAGDPSQVRHLLAILSDRELLPAKVLIFKEDARPGYYGTWTRSSRIVGPRTPFAQDILARDYGYDSGEEWEDENTSDVDDVLEGADDDVDGDEADSDLDSWLVDDDEDIETPPLDSSPSLPSIDIPTPTSKRKAETLGKQPEKKRKVVTPLVPIAKGPCWESTIGQCEYGPFESYRIQLFNDTPFPIDPFSFISNTSEELQDARAYLTILESSVEDASSATSLPLKRAAAPAPKMPFPDVHLSTLLAKIADLATPSLNYLVESIYQDLRVHKVKKNAIEAKVREVGEKSKDKKIWVVREAIRIDVGNRPL